MRKKTWERKEIVTMHGHWAECYSWCAPLFISGVGWIDGEVLETLWSLLNIVSGSTRGMTSSHQQELLDFQMNDSNFMKMIRMSKWESSLSIFEHVLKDLAANSLSRKLKATRKSLAATMETFTDLDSTVSKPQRQEWEQQERDAKAGRILDPLVMDIYNLHLSKGICTSSSL